MKALVYEKAHKLEDFAIELVDLAEPTLRDTDVLVEVRAIGVNPGEAFIRSVRSAEPGGRILLGWEFAGVMVGAGPAVERFKVGHRVFGTGDMISNARITNAGSLAFTETFFVVIGSPETVAFDQPVVQIQLWRVVVFHPVVDPNSNRIPPKQT